MKLNAILEAFFAPTRILVEAVNNTDYTYFFRNHTAPVPENLFDIEANTVVKGIVGLILTPSVGSFDVNVYSTQDAIIPDETKYGLAALAKFCRIQNKNVKRLVTLVQGATDNIFEDDSFEDEVDDFCDEFMEQFREVSSEMQHGLQAVNEFTNINFHVRFWGNMQPSQLRKSVLEVLKLVHTHPHKIHFEVIAKEGNWTSYEFDTSNPGTVQLLSQHMNHNSHCEWLEALFKDPVQFSNDYNVVSGIMFISGNPKDTILFEKNDDQIHIFNYDGKELHEGESENNTLYVNVAELMEESDESLAKLIAKTMVAYSPSEKTHVMFCEDALLEKAIKLYLKELQTAGFSYLDDIYVQNMDNFADGKAEWAIEHGLVDEDGDIDWDKVDEHPDAPDYADYDDEYASASKFLNMDNLQQGEFASAKAFRESYANVVLEEGIDDSRVVHVDEYFENLATAMMAYRHGVDMKSRDADGYLPGILNKAKEDISFDGFK